MPSRKALMPVTPSDAKRFKHEAPHDTSEEHSEQTSSSETALDGQSPEANHLMETEGRRMLRVLSSDGVTSEVKTTIFQRKSDFVKCFLRSGMRDANSGIIRVPFIQETLKPVLEFLQNHGKVRFNMASAITTLEVADYLGMAQLISKCATFLSSRVPEKPTECFALSKRFQLPDLRKAVLRHWARLPSFLLSSTERLAELLKPSDLSFILKQPDLGLNTEDQACDMLLSWLSGRAAQQEVPNSQVVAYILEQIRLGIVSPAKGMELCAAMDEHQIDVPALEQCRLGRFEHLSRSQTVRRSAHAWHLHVLWSEQCSPTGRTMSISCVKTHIEDDGDITSRPSTSAADSGNNPSEPAEGRQTFRGYEHSQLLRAVESSPMRKNGPIHLATADKILQVDKMDADHIVIRQLVSTSLEHQWTTKGVLFIGHSQGHLAAAMDESDRCIVTWFYSPGGQNFASVDLHTNWIDYSWKPYPDGGSAGEASSGGSVRDLHIGADFVALLRNRGLSIVDRKTGRQFKADLGKIVFLQCMTRLEDMLYVYEDRGDRIGSKPTSSNDRLHIVCVKSGRVVETVGVDHDVLADDNEPSRSSSYERLLINWEGHLVLVLSDVGVSDYFFLKFDTTSKRFRCFAQVPVTAPATDSSTIHRTFRSIVPLGPQQCPHETWMHAKRR